MVTCTGRLASQTHERKKTSTTGGAKAVAAAVSRRALRPAPQTTATYGKHARHSPGAMSSASFLAQRVLEPVLCGRLQRAVGLWLCLLGWTAPSTPRTHQHMRGHAFTAIEQDRRVQEQRRHGDGTISAEHALSWVLHLLSLASGTKYMLLLASRQNER